MSKTNREVVHEGWLIKSPPTKRIWRARWRRRWFTLRHSGELPGQFFLEYYTDRNCRKLKGTIDLDQCEQVDAGLLFEQRKYVFDLKTPSRVYYLAAESEQDMNSWVDCICQVCGLKAYSSDDQELGIPVSGAHELVDIAHPETRLTDTIPETPPLSPISGPYIPISECITGRPLTTSLGVQDFYCLLHRNATNTALNSSGMSSAQESDPVPFVPPTPQKRKHQQQHSISTTDIPNDQDPRFYDLPRQLQPVAAEPKTNPNWIETNMNSSLERASTPPLQSPTDSESVFTDDEWSHPVLPSENGIKEPRPSDSSIEMEPSSWSVVKRFGKLTVVDSPNLKPNEAVPVVDEAPPRPPKPSHLGMGPSYLNLGNSSTISRVKNSGKENVEIVQQTVTVNTEKPVETDSIQPPISDEMYDFPRSHNVSDPEPSKSILSTRHCYNNAAPSVVDGQVFRYDITATESMATEQPTQFDSAQDEEPASPCSQSSCSTTALYSNLPSPLLPPESQAGSGPPVVNRCLKPGRKLSDSASICSLPEPSSPRSAPNVDRKLKPCSQGQVRKTSEFEFDHGTVRAHRAAPSPTPPSFNSRDDDLGEEQVYFYQYNNQFLAASRGSKDFDKLQYLDLDLESDTYNGSMNVSQPPKSPGPLTVYKTVDFVKTEAFKRTRQCVEAARKQCSVEP